MRAVDGWLRRHAAREARRSSLADAFLGNQWPRYAWYRLRFFAARYLVGAGAYGVKMAFAFRVFADSHLGGLVAAHVVATFVAAFWWGALESLRERIRFLFRDGRGRLADREIAGWLRWSLILGGGLTGLLLLFVCWRAVAGFGPAEFYFAVIGVRLCIEIPVRCYHSGLYAVRRVYRPLPVMLATDVSGLIALAVLWPLFGAWAFGGALLVGTFASAASTIYYTRRAYWFLGLFPMRRLVDGDAERRPGSLDLRVTALAGVAAIALAGDGLLVSVVALAGASGSVWTALVFALSPSLRASVDASQLFYFDLKRLELAPFRNLRDTFVRWTGRLVAPLSVLLWGLGVGLAYLILADLSASVLFGVLPLFIGQAVLGHAQVDSFTEGSYVALIVAFVGMASVALAVAAVADQQVLVASLSLLSLVTALLLRRALRRRRDADGPLVAPLVWLERLGGQLRSVRVVTAEVAPSRDLSHSSRYAPGHPEAVQLARRVARRLGSRGVVTVPEAGRVTWMEPAEAPEMLSLDAVARMSAGLLTGFERREGAIDRGWVERLLSDRFLGRRAANAVRTAASPSDRDRLTEEFERLVPGGVACTPGAGAAARDALTADQRHEVLRAAVKHAHSLEPQRAAGYEVTASMNAGNLETIFLVPRRVPRSLRSDWATRLARSNIDESTACLGGASGSSVLPPAEPERYPLAVNRWPLTADH